MGGTEEEYFGYYGALMHQQNMLLDTVRTAAYRDAVDAAAEAVFAGRTVLDVGAGSGILSFFAARAGARRVYAVEASDMARHAKALVAANNLEHVITVVHGRVEDVDIPEPVDVLISEPMGVLLVHERMLESYVAARDRFLRPGGAVHAGRMWPHAAAIYAAPFADAALHADVHARAAFWDAADFHGVDLRALGPAARAAQFAQVVVGPLDPRTLLAAPCGLDIDLCTADARALQDLRFPLALVFEHTAVMHGLAAWFDVAFDAGAYDPSAEPTYISTAPTAPMTHWYQARLLLAEPLAVNAGQRVVGTLRMRANAHRSYDLDLEIAVHPAARQSSGADDCGPDSRAVPGTERRASYRLQDQAYWNLGYDPHAAETAASHDDH